MTRAYLHLLHPAEELLDEPHVHLLFGHVGLGHRRLGRGLAKLRVLQVPEAARVHTAAAHVALDRGGLQTWIQGGVQGRGEARREAGGERGAGGAQRTRGERRREVRGQARADVLGEAGVEALRDARDHHFGLFSGQGATFVVHRRTLGPQGQEVVSEFRHPACKESSFKATSNQVDWSFYKNDLHCTFGRADQQRGISRPGESGGRPLAA